MNISVIAYKEEDYPLLERYVTVHRVKELFAGIVKGEVVRYALLNICALNFVLYEALAGAVRLKHIINVGRFSPKVTR